MQRYGDDSISQGNRRTKLVFPFQCKDVKRLSLPWRHKRINVEDKLVCIIFMLLHYAIVLKVRWNFACPGHQRMQNDLQFREPKRNVDEDEVQTYSPAHDTKQDTAQV